jgi:YCII-related domain-containing protein
MSRFLVTYHGSGMPDDPELMEQAKQAFMSWVSEAGSAIVDPGAPVMMVTQVSSGSTADAAQIGGYSIIEADDVDAATSVLSSHPYVARGGTLQVNQILDV